MNLKKYVSTFLSVAMLTSSAFAAGSTDLILRSADGKDTRGWRIAVEGNEVTFNICKDAEKETTCRVDFKTNRSALGQLETQYQKEANTQKVINGAIIGTTGVLVLLSGKAMFAKSEGGDFPGFDFLGRIFYGMRTLLVGGGGYVTLNIAKKSQKTFAATGTQVVSVVLNDDSSKVEEIRAGKMSDLNNAVNDIHADANGVR